MQEYLTKVLENMPSDWLKLTTHRLDIYEEKLAKTQFLQQFEELYHNDKTDPNALGELPTAYDYIRLGHPLSSILEWAVAKKYDLPAQNLISFSSRMAPILAILRKNLFLGKKTILNFQGEIPDFFDAEVVRKVYGYDFEIIQASEKAESSTVDDSSHVYITSSKNIHSFDLSKGFDFYVNHNDVVGSILLVRPGMDEGYVREIQHVRRRETIAMTPANSLVALEHFVGKRTDAASKSSMHKNKASVVRSISEITQAYGKALVGSSGLSIQYAIMMGLIHDAQENHPGKAVKFIVPPNCYGGTNDQARRVAACLDHVEVVDLPVDGDNDMVRSIDTVLTAIAAEGSVPYIIAEIPTNPRVEVPDLQQLKQVLSVERTTPSGEKAIDPVFILDQTFCPNVHFLGEGQVLSTTRSISYASGSKFPSGGLCTAGYCVGNQMAKDLMGKIEKHLTICDNEATDLQYEILAKQLPSMNSRIQGAYENTRAFVDFIQEKLPEAKINFVSDELAEQGFTPSVFSLDLPTKGSTEEERESHKRALNLKLINLMITRIPDESKYCVSYGQLKGCYWTIPATSTQGTTKEGDKDYIVRAALSSDMDLEMHQQVFSEFVESLG